MRRRLTDGYENSRRLSDACGHIYKKKCILVIFGKFKKRNPRGVGFFRRILDRNVVVRVGRNCEDLQMRSGVVRDEIGGRKDLDEIAHVTSHLNRKYDIMLTWP